MSWNNIVPIGAIEPKRNAIICDLDGTLADCEWRRKLYLQGDKKDFEQFNMSSDLDKPNFWCKELVIGMHSVGYIPIFVTGRTDDCKVPTLAWLHEQFPLIEKPVLHMRPAGDHGKDADLKETIYRNNIEPYWNVLFVVDDRKSVVDMWRFIGLTCLQCAEGNF